jgi:glycosyltransferase involved in cell wall biosynthesis
MKSCILYIQPTKSTFMEVDYAILNSTYHVDKLFLNQTSKLSYITNLLTLFFSLHRLNKYTAFVVWFGDYHSAVAAFIKTILKKKMILFIGGYDAVYYPDKNIGVYKYAINNSDLIITNTESLIESNNLYIDSSERKSGLKHIIRNFHSHYEVIYNGIDVTKADAFNKAKEAKLVLTTGATANWEDIYNKGYDILIEVARMLPDYEFVFVGIAERWLQRLETEFHYKELSNLKILPIIPQQELFELFSISKVYAQPSISEGMPNALLEAMLFECIPVGSNVAGIPTVIDKYGVIISTRSASLLAAAIRKASDMDSGKAASNFIKENFSVQQRTIKICDAIERCIN